MVSCRYTAKGINKTPAYIHAYQLNIIRYAMYLYNKITETVYTCGIASDLATCIATQKQFLELWTCMVGNYDKNYQQPKFTKNWYVVFSFECAYMYLHARIQ